MSTHDSTTLTIAPALIDKMTDAAIEAGLRMRPILITGASGFVGQALARDLLNRGKQVVSMVRDRTVMPQGIVVYGDVRDADFCRRVIADYEVGTIYHLAAQAIVSTCAEDPITAIDVAAMGTARLLQAVRDSGRPIRVVVSTSDKVFGDAPAPYTEETPLDAKRAYEVSKACQDLVARMFAHNYGVDVSVVRAVNIYGPGDPNESRLIPKTILRLLCGEQPLVHAGAADMKRQYVYIDDMLNALQLVCVHGKPAEAFCVGGHGASLTVTEVISEIARQLGRDAVDFCEGVRDGRFQEIQEQGVSDDKLRALGWAPTVSFPDGIARTVAWYRDAAEQAAAA